MSLGPSSHCVLIGQLVEVWKCSTLINLFKEDCLEKTEDKSLLCSDSATSENVSETK